MINSSSYQLFFDELDFGEIIKQVNLVSSSELRDEIKLRKSGELLYQGSLSLLGRINNILGASKQQPIDSTETKIDFSFNLFLSSCTQHRVNTSFVSKYLTPQPRAKYVRQEDRRITSLSPTDFVELFDVEEFAATVSLAHDEDINSWLDLVEVFLENNRDVCKLPEIAQKTNLSKVQVFIALLFGNFEILQSGGFYSEIRIRLSASLDTTSIC